MSQVINTNIASITAQGNLNKTSGALQQSIERLSSGLRINSAADDAAGLAISERFSAQIGGLNQAQRNSQDGISFSQTAEGGLEEIGNIAQRIRELAVQSANDTNSASDRQALNEEVQQLVQEADRIAETTAFNNQNVLDGSLEDLIFQVGANQGETIDVDGVNARTAALGQTVLAGGDDELGAVVDTNDIDGDTVTINGVDFVGDTDFGDMAELVDAINSADFGDAEPVTAQQESSTVANLGDAAPGDSESFTINTIEIDGDSDLSEVVDNINAASAETGGVTAELIDGDIVIEDASGDPIELGGTNVASFGNLEGDATLEAAVNLSVNSMDDGALTIGGAEAEALGFNADNIDNETFADVSVATQEYASETIGTMDAVIDQINSQRGELGAIQNRFESTIANLGVGVENLEAARSRIVDTDFAAETANLTQQQILQQAGTSVLGQANQIPQNVVGLLQ